MYFLLMNPSCAQGVLPENKISQFMKDVIELDDNILKVRSSIQQDSRILTETHLADNDGKKMIWA